MTGASPLRIVLGYLVIGIGILAIVLAAIRAEQQLNALNFNAFDDWRTYANAAERWMDGERIYTPEQVSGPYELRDTLRTGFTYPPATVVLFVPFSSTPYGLVAWIAINLGAFLLGAFAVLRRELGHVGPLAIGLTLLGAAAFPPFSNAVVSGNVNLGLAGALAWLWTLERWRVGAVVAGLGAAIKLFPGLMAAWPARRSGVRAFAVAAGAAVAIGVVTLPLVGVDAWADFVAALRNAQPECAPQSISIACGLSGILGAQTAQLIGIVASLALVVAAWRARSDFVAYAAMAGALLAPVVDMHPHYWLFGWVVVFVGITRQVGRIQRRRLAA